VNRTAGARDLARLGKTQAAIALKIGVSRIAVQQWLSGTTRPNDEKRAKICDAFGIAAALWDAPLQLRATAEQAIVANGGAFKSTPDLLSKSKELENMIYKLMDQIDADQAGTHQERSKSMASCTQTLAIIAKLTGQFDLGKRIFQLPQWKQIEKTFEHVLMNYPDAAAALAIELRKLEAQATG
jgi:transcriptional regulator with XRE-family HTH domain